MLNYCALDSLARIAREKSFVKAAKSMRITQSALSQRIKVLEENIGIPLLIRDDPIRPTATGQKLIAHYHQVAHLESSLTKQLAARASDSTPHPIAIAVNTESLATWFVKTIKDVALEKRFILQIIIEDSERSHRLVREGKVLGCVTSVQTAGYGCTSEFLGHMNYHCVASPRFVEQHFKQAISGKSLLKAPAIIYGEHDHMHENYLKECFKNYGQGTPLFHWVPSPQGIVEFAELGIGYALLPNILIRHSLQKGKLVDLMPDRTCQLSLYWHAQEFQTPITSQLCQAVIKNAHAILDRSKK